MHVQKLHFVCAYMLSFTEGHLADRSKKQSPLLKVDTYMRYDLHCKAGYYMFSWLGGIGQMRFWQLTITWYKIHYAVKQTTFRRHPKEITKFIQSLSINELFCYVPVCYLLFSMTDLYHGQICRGVSKFDSALWEINSVILILSARLHQLCVL